MTVFIDGIPQEGTTRIPTPRAKATAVAEFRRIWKREEQKHDGQHSPFYGWRRSPRGEKA